MVKEHISEIKETKDGCFVTICKTCNNLKIHKTKGSAKRGLNKDCKKCTYSRRKEKLSASYKIIFDEVENKWCSTCPSCNSIQKYTRFDHAKSSEINGWSCKKCSNSSSNKSIGDNIRIYNKFKKMAIRRGIEFNLSIEQFNDLLNESNLKCFYSGIELTTKYNNCTLSLDRTDNSIGYILGNVKIVHTMVNMMKRHYSEIDFIDMCRKISNHYIITI